MNRAKEWVAAAAIGLLCGACQGPAAEAGASPAAAESAPESGAVDAGQVLRATKDGSVWVRFRSTPDPLPVNEPFELAVELFGDAAGREPVEGALVFVRGYMPDHGHGMIREPESEEIEPGVYRVKGMLFHMVGSWQLSIDVIRDGLGSSIDYEVTL